MANVNIAAEQLIPYGDNKGRKKGIIVTVAKAAQNDTVTVTNAKSIVFAAPQTISSGAADTYTVSTNVITLTGATTGNVRIELVYI